jgi:acyl-[acyl-carrier-protein]-phospholipid O-acyltransferase/long-chain-fatty-acid--[acyl-carrier-protein] ligase
MAVAGGLFIVPAFAAVQAWSGADYRARTIAGVNVLNAGFMTVATVVVALLQKQGVTLPLLFAGLGIATLIVAGVVWKTQPKSASS